MRMKLLALVAVIGSGVDPRVLVHARVGGRNNPFLPRGRGASQAVLEHKGLSRAGIHNINAKNVPCNSQSSCNVFIADGDVEMDIALEPSRVRAPGYKLLVQGEDGELAEADPGPETTYHGRVEGDAGSSVAASITAAGVLMEIFMSDGEEVVVEPVDTADAEVEGDHAVYHKEDVIPTPGKMCGAMALQRRSLEEDDRAQEPQLHEHLHLHPFHGHHHHHHLRHPHEEPAHKLGTSERKLQGLDIAELAADADYEYFLDHGSSANAVESRIEGVINAVNLQYESEVGITHKITNIIVRTAEPDPYNSTDAYTMLTEFRNEWNANQGSIQRDVAQLFTGKDINGGTIGIAWVGVVCHNTLHYGLVESDFNGNYASVTDLSAHELGHNWNAGHCSCTSNTMNPYITSSNTFHPSLTIPVIESFRDSRSCIDRCGDDFIDTGETCDGSALNGQTCGDFGCTGGVLGCLSDCSGFDASGCTGCCGDDIIDTGETCDGADLGGATCASAPGDFDDGTLGCLGDCSGFDTGGCTKCGDGSKEGGEVCDGSDLGGATCFSQGFAGGNLRCAKDCSSFDTSGCCDPAGAGCTSNSDCCSNKCRGPRGRMSCKG